MGRHWRRLSHLRSAPKMMKTHPPTTRRHFLQSMLAAAAAPMIVPARVLGGEDAPSKKVQLGHIGVGGQGTRDLHNFLGVAGAVSVAVADPYEERRASAAGFIKEQQG